MSTRGRKLSRLNGAPCCYCGTPMTRTGDPQQRNYATKDHVFPAQRGGTLRNSVRCCRQCNEDKQNLTINEWRAALIVRYRGRVTPLFYFERLAIQVSVLQALEYVRRWAVTLGF